MAKSDSDDEARALIGRTDALLKKHRPRAHANFAGTPIADLDIPVLTEIVEPAVSSQAAAPAASQLDTERLALHLHQEVLRSLQPQIESLLDQRLGQTLSLLLEQVLHGMEAELKVSLRAMVRDAVAAAVDREVLRITAGNPDSPAAPPSGPARR